MLLWALWEWDFVSWKPFPRGPWPSLCAVESKERQTTSRKTGMLFIVWMIKLHLNNKRLLSGNKKKNIVDRIYYTKSVSWSVSWRWPAVFCSASQLSEPLQARELTKLYAEHGRFWELHYCTGSRVWSQTAPPESTVTFPLWKWCRHNSMALPLTSHHHPARD